MKKNKKVTTLFSLLIIPVFFSGLFAGISPCKESPGQKVTLEFWSVFDNSDIYRPLIAEFTKQNPSIAVNYYKKNTNTYETELIGALAAGRGPDIFSIHNTWLPKHIDKLAPIPEKTITPKRVNELFVDAVAQDFVSEDKVYALPLSVDSLALFYNKDLFNSAGIAQPPKTWIEFNAAVEKLTRRDDKNNILFAGVALGTAKNINRSTDILALLMLQSGAKMVSEDKSAAAFNQATTLAGGEVFYPGEQALTFYTNFANPIKKVYTWNQYQHYSLDAFVEGRAAMMFNYAYQIPLLRNRAPHLNFEVVPIPKISEENQAISFANYWGQAVSKTSLNTAAAWSFLSFLVSQESAKKYASAAQKPVARRDLINWQKSDLNLSIFASQALVAKSWWEVDNLAVELIFAQMIDSVVVDKVSPKEAIQKASAQITVLMQKKKRESQ